jgi:tetratricopeptide (TPR) repeat protein
MDRDFRAYPFKAAAVALIAALAGCAPRPEPTITNDTRAQLARALQESGDATTAAIVRNQAGQQAGQTADPLTHATALVTAGQVDEGMKVAMVALASRGDDLDFACEVGRLAVRSGRLDDAGAVYRQILRRHPDSVQALNGIGVVLAQQGDLNDAADAFRKALGQRPDDVPARHNLALVETLTGKAGAAALPETPQAAAVPAPGPDPGNRRIVLRARTPAWMEVRDASGQVLLGRELAAGETWPVPNEAGLVLATGNAGGTEILVDGVATAPLGGAGKIMRNIPLDADAIRDGKLPAQIRAARAAAGRPPGGAASAAE